MTFGVSMNNALCTTACRYDYVVLTMEETAVTLMSRCLVSTGNGRSLSVLESGKGCVAYLCWRVEMGGAYLWG